MFKASTDASDYIKDSLELESSTVIIITNVSYLHSHQKTVGKIISEMNSPFKLQPSNICSSKNRSVHFCSCKDSSSEVKR